MKSFDLTLWILVLFLLPVSFAQLIETSQTPSQSAYEIGINQTPQGTETPSQWAFLAGPNQTLLGEQTPTKQSNATGLSQTTPEIQGRILPGIEIVSPKEGTVSPAGNVTVTANVTNFKLVNMLGDANVAGEGHIHFYIDVPVPTTPGKPAITPVGTFAPTYNTSWTWPNVAPGKHNFSVQLANNDHTPLIPPVIDQVNVTLTNNSKMNPTM